jgi:hypothetical protein
MGEDRVPGEVNPEILARRAQYRDEVAEVGAFWDALAREADDKGNRALARILRGRARWCFAKAKRLTGAL